jgi:NADPH-dependent ferric siderophore reductase
MGGTKLKPTQSAVRRRQEIGGDDCDLRFRTDLMGVRTAIAERVRPGDVLDVALRRDKAMRSVVCQTDAHEVVGALSAFPGLAQLIGCMEKGAKYSALVEKSSARSCTVLVWRTKQ